METIEITKIEEGALCPQSNPFTIVAKEATIVGPYATLVGTGIHMALPDDCVYSFKPEPNVDFFGIGTVHDDSEVKIVLSTKKFNKIIITKGTVLGKVYISRIDMVNCRYVINNGSTKIRIGSPAAIDKPE